jgi:site-specific DNA-methyltransferase (adenine-specific)
MGSGTTAKMAQINNRRYLGFEISPEYIEIINKRLKNVDEDFD